MKMCVRLVVSVGATPPGQRTEDGQVIVPPVCVTCSRQVVPTAGLLEKLSVVLVLIVAWYFAFVPHAMAVPESVAGAGAEIGIVMLAVPSKGSPLIVRAVCNLVAVAALNVDPL